MSDANETDNDPAPKPGSKRRNIILGIFLACAALTMYVSIFVRLSENPLS